jgi:CRISPR-associated endonuclease/helicase Cas3
LTLQTGDALRERLSLEKDDLAVLIGSQAVQQLHEINQASIKIDNTKKNENSFEKYGGSESREELIDELNHIIYEGSLDDGKLSQWLKKNQKLHQLVSAPVVVSTIDYLIPATEGTRGGKQIAPMLRLLTSDLILDEPDDFDLNDLPALTRLVNWAGMLGSRVLLSSATMPPSLVKALFEAYLSGRKVYQSACGDKDVRFEVCCAWFDEQLKPHQSNHAETSAFEQAHLAFINQRIHELKQLESLRQAKLVNVFVEDNKKESIFEAVATTLHESIIELHKFHGIQYGEKNISIGLIRMANINQMISVVKKFIKQPPKDDFCIHFCVYHSQHLLLVRSEIEKRLDRVLQRHNEEKFFQAPDIQKISSYKQKNHIFIVFATPVAEVGRDHDYDWAIAEPSSMRSLIQLAGRVQRHRQKIPQVPNLHILHKNIRALKTSNNDEVVYKWPGFESKEFLLKSKDLHNILRDEEYQHLSAIPRIKEKEYLDFENNLVDLEHKHLNAKLFSSDSENKIHASLWWMKNPTWCAYLQEETRFRKSEPQENFFLYLEEEGESLIWKSGDMEETKSQNNRFKNVSMDEDGMADNIQLWIENDVEALLVNISNESSINLSVASRRYATVSLRKENNGDIWEYHPIFGIYKID